MLNKLEISKNWLTRYTGMPLDRFGDYVLLTNFNNYVRLFAEHFGCDVYGEDRTMPTATNDAGSSRLILRADPPPGQTITAAVGFFASPFGRWMWRRGWSALVSPRAPGAPAAPVAAAPVLVGVACAWRDGVFSAPRAGADRVRRRPPRSSPPG